VTHFLRLEEALDGAVEEARRGGPGRVRLELERGGTPVRLEECRGCAHQTRRMAHLLVLRCARAPRRHVAKQACSCDAHVWGVQLQSPTATCFVVHVRLVSS
jgi:hypothetical protein